MPTARTSGSPTFCTQPHVVAPEFSARWPYIANRAVGTHGSSLANRLRRIRAEPVLYTQDFGADRRFRVEFAVDFAPVPFGISSLCVLRVVSWRVARKTLRLSPTGR